MSTDNELAPQESVEAATLESAPETTTEEIAQETETEVDQEASTAVEETTEHKGSGPTKAVKELIDQRKKRQKAEQEAAYWRGQAEARISKDEPRAPQAPITQLMPIPPSLENFETFEEYEKAKDEYIITTAEYRISQQLKQRQQEAQQQQLSKTFEQRLIDAAKEDPSIVEIRNDPTLPISETMAHLLRRSESSPQILKWLNNNREKSASIAKMDPISAAMEFGKIEATLLATPKPQLKKVSAAPTPIKTVQASTPSSIDEDDLPMEEYYKRRTKQLYGR